MHNIILRSGLIILKNLQAIAVIVNVINLTSPHLIHFTSQVKGLKATVKHLWMDNNLVGRLFVRHT